MVAILDFGIGNLMAIQNIIRKAGGQAVITSDKVAIENANKIILPGVGAFDYGMEQLENRGLIEVLNEQVLARKKTTLGLCLGAQLMTEQSEEGSRNGLGWVKAITKKFDSKYVAITPHMGWANVNFSMSNVVTEGLESEASFYFVHSFHFHFSDPGLVFGTAWYGYEFPCAFRYENIYGVQFHPEKSHRFGVRFFRNFLSI